MCLAGRNDVVQPPQKGASSTDATQALPLESLPLWYELLQSASGFGKRSDLKEPQGKAQKTPQPSLPAPTKTAGAPVKAPIARTKTSSAAAKAAPAPTRLTPDPARMPSSKTTPAKTPSASAKAQSTRPGKNHAKPTPKAPREQPSQTTSPETVTILGLLGQSETAPMLSKTRMCRFFASGQCTRGDKCSFAHNSKELQKQPDLYRTQLCLSFISAGSCSYGASCKYAHSVAELQPVHEAQSDTKSPQEQQRLQMELDSYLQHNARESRKKQVPAPRADSDDASTPSAITPASSPSLAGSLALTTSTCGSDVDLSDALDTSKPSPESSDHDCSFKQGASSVVSGRRTKAPRVRATRSSKVQVLRRQLLREEVPPPQPAVQRVYSDGNVFVCRMKNTFLEFVPEPSLVLHRSKSSPHMLGA